MQMIRRYIRDASDRYPAGLEDSPRPGVIKGLAPGLAEFLV